MASILSDVVSSIEDETTQKIEQYELETKELTSNNPFSINDELAEHGFESSYDAVYRYYNSDSNKDYYLKITRESGKKFKLNYVWCIKEDGQFIDYTSRFNSTNTILDGKEDRNKKLGQYSEEGNLPRNKQKVADYLNETWNLIIQATDCLKILKDDGIEYNINKYSTSNIIKEYITLSDVVVDNHTEFRLLYVKSEYYKLFLHDVTTDEERIVATFSWQKSPEQMLKEENDSDAIILFTNTVENINLGYDGHKVKDCLLKSLVELQSDIDKRLEIISNANAMIKEQISDAVSTLNTKINDNITEQIKEKLAEHKTPSVQLLADFLNTSGEFFIVHDIQKRFRKTNYGFFEVTTKDISNFFNNTFGYNKISMKKCNDCMDFITRELTINYDMLQFKNGLYSTTLGEFFEGVYAERYIPKMSLDRFNYIPDAKEQFMATDLYKENHEILKSEVWDWNENIFYKSVGSCYYATNVADKLFIIVGLPDSRKSTLLQIIKRIFNDNYSSLKIQVIVNNERFTLAPCINKSVNIDDDASDLQLKNIGSLNTFVSGTGLSVELKNQNESVLLNEFNTPRIWCASNELFNVIGSGFKRRLCLILCENTFDRESSSKHYMVNINNGGRDKELELMISYCLQLYHEEKDKAFLTKEQEDAMFNEFEFKSYPERRFVQDVFLYGDKVASNLKEQVGDKWPEIPEHFKNMFTFPTARNTTTDDYVEINSDDPKKANTNDDVKSEENSGIDDNTTLDAVDLERWCITCSLSNHTDATIPTIISKNDATIICREYLNYQLEKGRIFKTQAIPSVQKIKTAMEGFGFTQTNKNHYVGGKRTSTNVFDNVVLNPVWVERLNLTSLYDETVKNYIIGGG